MQVNKIMEEEDDDDEPVLSLMDAIAKRKGEKRRSPSFKGNAKDDAMYIKIHTMD
jgi:hypothetical protein